MLESLLIKSYQLQEHWKDKGFLSAAKTSLYKYEEAVPVKKDLSNLKPLSQEAEKPNLKIIEVNKDNYGLLKKEHLLKSRSVMVKQYIDNGYMSFCLLNNNQIVGDLWYVTKSSAKTSSVHPHLKKYNISLDNDDVYMFGMYMRPDCRGGGLTTYFMNSVLHQLRDKGFKRAYGYFSAQNIPALWIHRLIGWEELRRYEVKRFLFCEISKPKLN